MGPVPLWAAALTGMRGAPVVWTAVSRVAAAEVRRRLPGGTPVHVIPNAVEAPPRPVDAVAERRGVRLVSTMRVAHRKRPLDAASDLRPRVRDAAECRSPSPSWVTDRCATGSSGLPAGWTLARLHPGHRTARAEACWTSWPAPTCTSPPRCSSPSGWPPWRRAGVGLPVVGRLGTGLADFIEDGRGGLLCADDTEMAAALVRLVDDAALRRRISEHNRTVEHGMSWPHSLDTHERIYSLARGDARSGEVVRLEAGLTT